MTTDTHVVVAIESVAGRFTATAASGTGCAATNAIETDRIRGTTDGGDATSHETARARGLLTEMPHFSNTQIDAIETRIYA